MAKHRLLGSYCSLMWLGQVRFLSARQLFSFNLFEPGSGYQDTAVLLYLYSEALLTLNTFALETQSALANLGKPPCCQRFFTESTSGLIGYWDAFLLLFKDVLPALNCLRKPTINRIFTGRCSAISHIGKYRRLTDDKMRAYDSALDEDAFLPVICL
jgi:hypothetical protein